ncbi:MAG: DUF192 domain-containing protein [Chloroflexota bacterium]
MGQTIPTNPQTMPWKGNDVAAQRYRITNTTRKIVLADAGQKAQILRRGIGLMGRRTLPRGEALIIQPCNSVVSFFMRFSIDVLFVKQDGEIAYVLHRMVPWRTSRIVRGAKFVVELPAGIAQETGTEAGDRITVEPADPTARH